MLHHSLVRENEIYLFIIDTIRGDNRKSNITAVLLLIIRYLRHAAPIPAELLSQRSSYPSGAPIPAELLSQRSSYPSGAPAAGWAINWIECEQQ